jgi:superfamily II DNA helicase RecQ
MEKDCAFANLEDKYTFKFKEQQKVAVESILDGKDTFIVLPRFYCHFLLFFEFKGVFVF